jgi:hypothetical protein
MFEKQTSTFSPFWVLNLRPFVWISKLPSVFLPVKFGLTTKLSNCSLFPLFSKISDSNSFSPYAAFNSDSVSSFFTFFRHSLIYLLAIERRLFADEDLVFIVSSFIQRLLRSSIGGYYIVFVGAVWKFILKNVH